MALLTVQQVADAVEVDVRQQLDSTTEAAFFIQWVDFVHKDVVYSTRFRHLASARETITSVASQTAYAIAATNIRSVDWVYDEENSRVLLPDTQIQTQWVTTEPESVHAAQMAKPISLNLHNAKSPLFYRLQTTESGGTYTHTLLLLPTPATSYAGNIIMSYTNIIDTLTLVGDTLLVSDDALPLVISGVNALGFSYLKRPIEMDKWTAIYTALKSTV